MNIYQAIWDADQAGSGIKPVLTTDKEAPDESQGYVRVLTTAPPESTARILPEAVIPKHKRRTYDLVRVLFDNYALPEKDPEAETPQERLEIHDLLSAVVDSAPMLVARKYVEEATGTSISSQRWYSTLLELWFRQFQDGGDPALSGFEHVFVGEQEGPKVQGYHFWYKYYLDDGLKAEGVATFHGLEDDRIVYLRGQYTDGQEAFPESVTVSYKWNAPDYDRKQVRPLTKAKGGFFVGCSVEGLMAIGTVRAHLGARAPKEAVINGARYDLKLFHSPNKLHIRTFFPVYLGPSATLTGQPDESTTNAVQEPVVPGKFRILAALVNPVGNDDQGHERVILANSGTAAAALDGYRLRDANKNELEISNALPVPAGGSLTIDLPIGSLQLSNKGGEITLLDPQRRVAHRVSYSKAQARVEGQLISF